MYALWNETDNVYAAPESFKTKMEARAYARNFRKRFTQQGYYLTADRLRIKPSQVRLVVIEIKDENTG